MFDYPDPYDLGDDLVDFDPLDAGDADPQEPDCFDCYDSRPVGAYCRSCHPSPRQRRRLAFRLRRQGERDARDRAAGRAWWADSAPF